MIKAVICDIDNTLADGVSWYRITESLGVSVQEHQSIFEAFLAGSITYAESKERLLGLWRSSGKADKEHLTALFENSQLRAGALELIEFMRAKEWSTVLITGSVDLFAEIISRKLSVQDWYANTRLVWNDAGELVDYDYRKDQAAVKLQQLQEFARARELSAKDCAVLGDGDNDVAIFKATGNGIAVGNANPDLLRAAWKHVATLNETRQLLEEL